MTAYLDDILMNRQNAEQHKQHVHKVFLRITIFDPEKGLHVYTVNRVCRWETILLNDNFKMEFLLSKKKLCHADGLSRLILKHREPLEDIVIASLRTEGEFKTTLCNTVKELPVTLDQIK